MWAYHRILDGVATVETLRVRTAYRVWLQRLTLPRAQGRHDRAQRLPAQRALLRFNYGSV
jgi:hypothetical protein